MRELVINSDRFSTSEELHLYLMEELHFPDYYGRDLSALHDCLTDISQETVLIFEMDGFQSEEIARYMKRVLRVVRDSAKENANITVMVNEEKDENLSIFET